MNNLALLKLLPQYARRGLFIYYSFFEGAFISKAEDVASDVGHTTLVEER